MGQGVKSLVAYDRAVTLASEVRKLVVAWPAFDRRTIGHQLARAAGSTGANIAEAYGRCGYPDRRRMIFIARGSALEAEHWLRLAEAAQLEGAAEARSRANEVSRLVHGLARIGAEI